MAYLEYDTDVIIVGSGILGSLAAWYLASQGKSVVILEAGPRIERWQIVEQFRNNPEKENRNRPYPEQPWAPKSFGGTFSDSYLENTGPVTFKPTTLKLVGGTTWRWAGAAWRYLPQDMKLKSTYNVGRDWPINYDELEHWYQLTEEALGVCGNPQEDQSGKGHKDPFPRRSRPYPLPQLKWSTYTQTFAQTVKAAGFRFIDEPQARNSLPFDHRPACHGNNNCTSICPIAAMYSADIHARKAESAGAHIIEKAIVYKLEKSQNNKITAVHYKTPTGESHRLSARYVILAANGIETPKILLLSEAANSSDQVGRNLMAHTGTELTFLAQDPIWPGRGPIQQGCIANWRDGKFRINHAAIRHTLNNAIPNLSIAERLIQQGYWGKDLNQKIRHDAARWISLSTVFETLPHAKNRITLSHNIDALGIPKPTIYYDVDNYVKNAATVAKKDYKKIVDLFKGSVINEDTSWKNHNHIMGSVIMGNNPKKSVVDRDCRTHDHPNLFLATTGVIPACGVVNPTLTGAALALRIAKTVGDEL